MDADYIALTPSQPPAKPPTFNEPGQLSLSVAEEIEGVASPSLEAQCMPSGPQAQPQIYQQPQPAPPPGGPVVVSSSASSSSSPSSLPFSPSTVAASPIEFQLQVLRLQLQEQRQIQDEQRVTLQVLRMEIDSLKAQQFQQPPNGHHYAVPPAHQPASFQGEGKRNQQHLRAEPIHAAAVVQMPVEVDDDDDNRVAPVAERCEVDHCQRPMKVHCVYHGCVTDCSKRICKRHTYMWEGGERCPNHRSSGVLDCCSIQ